MPRRAKSPFPNKAVAIALVLSMAANCYLVLHFVHVDLQPTSPLLKIAMRRIRGMNRSIELVHPTPPDELLDPSPTNESFRFKTNYSMMRAHDYQDELHSQDSRNASDESGPGTTAAFQAALDDAVGVFSRMFDRPSFVARGTRCPGNLPCDNFSASFSRQSWNRPAPPPRRLKLSRRGFKRCSDAHRRYAPAYCTHALLDMLHIAFLCFFQSPRL